MTETKEKVQKVDWRNVRFLTIVLGLQGLFIVIYILLWMFSGNWCGRVLPDGTQEIYFGKEVCKKVSEMSCQK
jgi:hypothetical protein